MTYFNGLNPAAAEVSSVSFSEESVSYSNSDS